MRLQSLIPTIPGDLVAALEACGIRTDTDLLFSGSSIEILQRLSPGAVSLADLETCIGLVAENASARGIRGDELHAEALQKSTEDVADINCGVDELDALVGGFGSRRVFEISGERGSGKTSLVLQIALRFLAADEQASVLWMDTTGDFSVDRTTRAAQALDGEGLFTALERLHVSLVLDIETAHVLLQDLLSSFTSNTSSEHRVRLVVIDSITPLLAPSLSAVSSQGHAIMTTFMQHLRSLARTYSLTFLNINNTSASLPHNPLSAFSSTVRKPALGPSFTFLSDCTVWLARHEATASAEEETSIHVAEVFRSRSTVRAKCLRSTSFLSRFTMLSLRGCGVLSRFNEVSYAQRRDIYVATAFPLVPITRTTSSSVFKAQIQVVCIPSPFKTNTKERQSIFLESVQVVVEWRGYVVFDHPLALLKGTCPSYIPVAL